MSGEEKFDISVEKYVLPVQGLPSPRGESTRYSTQGVRRRSSKKRPMFDVPNMSADLFEGSLRRRSSDTRDETVRSVSASSGERGLPVRWAHDSIRHAKLWIVQMTETSYMLNRSAQLMSRLRTFFKIAAAVFSAYTTIVPIPAVGCGMVAYGTCVSLQWSGIIASLLSAVVTLLDAQINPAGLVVNYQTISQRLAKLARDLDICVRSQTLDEESALAIVSEQYTGIMETLPDLSDCLYGRTELLNLTLLTEYDKHRGNEASNEILASLADELAEINRRLDRGASS